MFDVSVWSDLLVLAAATLSVLVPGTVDARLRARRTSASAPRTTLGSAASGQHG